ncbi:MAG TPA: hybrid sensor histidine kinase/response regulator [Cyanobacteria bacterium UBA12227]|nr:hybrid sensor histidine kinase/response regulator [Cyanobacteria bacterium UBA12227]HAX90050.1 hybrid sensor histidine kinase/response regulator [Cyanobacteria bacterium UBA11370]
MNTISADESNGYILIVDDQPNNLRLLSTTLTNAGYKVKNAISAQMALVGIQAALPELILLDIMMPDLNGYELCQQLKASPETQNIPVIFLSALDDEDSKLKAFEFGGVDYITKPFQVKEVLARVQNQLTIVRQQQKLAQQNIQLQQLNVELARSNKDLEEFAYIASHDLRSPLQTMKAFAYLLDQKYQGLLDNKADRYITRIVQATNRMEQLIQDLLNYSRVGTNTIQFKQTDCNKVVAEVLINLQAAINVSGAVITYDKLPIVRGNATQLEQLFQNLIGNGIKFRRPDIPVEVKISVEERKKNVSLSSSSIQESEERSEWLFGIHDNGIGIEPQYFDRIFQVFQRLHTIEEYPGTGIGLAIAKKIVDRHQGEIWLESSLDLGTTFYFTIPV